MQIEHSEFQDQLVRGLSHRMNNILTIFHGYIGLLLDNKRLDKGTIDGLGRIQDGAKAACDLMDRANSLVRPSVVVWREVELRDFIEMLKPSFEGIRGSKTELILDIPEGLPSIWADASRVRSGIFELVRNALEATYLKGGTVRIEVRAGERPAGTSLMEAKEWVSLRVMDDGPGIAENVGDRVYQPFYSTKKNQPSAGLGLAVVAGVASQHGGLLRYESKVGATTFELILPGHAG